MRWITNTTTNIYQRPRWHPGLNSYFHVVTFEWNRPRLFVEDPPNEAWVNKLWNPGLNAYFHVVTNEWWRPRLFIESDPWEAWSTVKWSPGLNNYKHIVTNEWYRRRFFEEPIPEDVIAKIRWSPGLTQAVQAAVENLPWFKRKFWEEALLDELLTKPRWSPGLNNYFHVVTIEWRRRQSLIEPVVVDDILRRLIGWLMTTGTPFVGPKYIGGQYREPYDPRERFFQEPHRGNSFPEGKK